MTAGARKEVTAAGRSKVWGLSVTLAYVCYLPPFPATFFLVINHELVTNINEFNMKILYNPVGP